MLSFSHFQGKASKRKQVLDEAYGQQGFLADSRDLVNFSHYSHYWNALSFICSRVKSSYLDMCCKPNMSPQWISFCVVLIPKQWTTLKGHHGPFFGHWCDPEYLPFTVGNRKFRLENQMVCAIPFGKLQETRAFAEEGAFFHSLVSLSRVKFNCPMFTHKFLKFDG